MFILVLRIRHGGKHIITPPTAFSMYHTSRIAKFINISSDSRIDFFPLMYQMLEERFILLDESSQKRVFLLNAEIEDVNVG